MLNPRRPLEDAEGRRWCAKCKTFRPRDDWGANYSYCRDCFTKVQRIRRRTRMEDFRRATLRGRWSKLFGKAEAERLLKMDPAHCEICGQSRTYPIRRNGDGTLRRLCLDHSHTTGKPRGFLCSECNTAIGLLHEDHKRFEACVAYLKRYSESE